MYQNGIMHRCMNIQFKGFIKIFKIHRDVNTWNTGVQISLPYVKYSLLLLYFIYIVLFEP